MGAAMFNWIKHGELKAESEGSISEGIGQGRITGLVQWQDDGPLAVSSATPFTMSLAPPGAAATDFYVNVEALTPLEE